MIKTFFVLEMDEEIKLKLEGLEVTEEEDLSTTRSSQHLDKELNELEETTLLADDIITDEEDNFFGKELNKKSPIEGELDEDTVYENISCIQKADHGNLQNLTFSGANLNLRDISILAKYTHLQAVDVSHNQISNLSALDNLNCLLILNVSHNLITKLLDFKPPKNLKHANFSHNQIEEIPDLSAYHYLSELYLDNNRISEIKGLSKCHRLSRLSLRYNHISKIKNIESLPLKYLNLSNNQIFRIENLETLSWLREIDLSCNWISSLQGLEKHHLLESINVNNNQIHSIEEISYIKDLILLRSFTILQNPISQIFNYHLAILFQIQRLLELNGSPVSITDKVEALNLFNPCLEVVAAKTHMMLTFYSFLKPCRISDITMSNINDPYPMLVMVGPEGSGNKELAMKLAEEFSENFGYGIPETTRQMLTGEVDGKDYNFNTLNHFQQEVLNGEFIVTNQYRGDYYGLKSKTLESIAQEGKGCITHMQLEAMATLKNSYLQPRFILTVHSTKEEHKRHMQDTGVYTEAEIEHALYSRDAFIEYNQEHPGGFFIVIITDNMEFAHQKLWQLVKSWIGTSEKLPRLSPIGNQLEKETCPTRPNSVAEQPLYTAPMIGFVEEESLKRRYQNVKKVVQAYVPPLYEQITRSASSASTRTYGNSLKESLDNPPQSRNSSDEPSSDESLNTFTSAPNTSNFSKSVKRESSYDEQFSKSNSGSVDRLVLSSQMEGTDDSGLNSKSKTFVMTPTPPAAPRPKSSSSSHRYSRLGSTKHQIIPPIATTNNEK